MTERIREFLRKRKDEGPCLVVDLDVVRDNYTAFAKALPDTRVFYAVKANPAPEVLALLAKLGSCFDTASIPEIEMVLAAGATPDRISYGNTIKKERDIARAFTLGVRLYAVDCKAEVEKVSRAAPGSRVFCRILSDCVGAEWPLSRKFGCEPAMAVDVLEHALKAGLEPIGVSFHVGSQQRNQHAWDRALASASAVFRECGERGINLTMVNLGGGFPTKYLKNVPSVKTYGTAIFKALRKHFGNRIPETIIEPGRGMVGNAGTIEAEVVLVSKKSEATHHVTARYIDKLEPSHPDYQALQAIGKELRDQMIRARDTLSETELRNLEYAFSNPHELHTILTSDPTVHAFAASRQASPELKADLARLGFGMQTTGGGFIWRHFLDVVR